MKKILVIFFMLLVMPAFADTMPYYIKSIPKDAIGLFQAGEKLMIYSQPEINSEVKKEFNFSYNSKDMPENVFGVLINEKKLGLMYVSDIGDDNWVEVIYDRNSGERGWVISEDRLQFMPWISFYNMYGRKYGLRILKDAPEEVNILHSGADDGAQNIAKINYVKTIKLTKLSGNWALVSVLDLDKVPKVGFMRWRTDRGVIYVFPNVK